jgi:hypothetical protein
MKTCLGFTSGAAWGCMRTCGGEKGVVKAETEHALYTGVSEMSVSYFLRFDFTTPFSNTWQKGQVLEKEVVKSNLRKSET